jgi:hypothetical protein
MPLNTLNQTTYPLQPQNSKWYKPINFDQGGFDMDKVKIRFLAL